MKGDYETIGHISVPYRISGCLEGVGMVAHHLQHCLLADDVDEMGEQMLFVLRPRSLYPLRLLFDSSFLLLYKITFFFVQFPNGMLTDFKWDPRIGNGFEDRKEHFKIIHKGDLLVIGRGSEVVNLHQGCDNKYAPSREPIHLVVDADIGIARSA